MPQLEQARHQQTAVSHSCTIAHLDSSKLGYCSTQPLGSVSGTSGFFSAFDFLVLLGVVEELACAVASSGIAFRLGAIVRFWLEVLTETPEEESTLTFMSGRHEHDHHSGSASKSFVGRKARRSETQSKGERFLTELHLALALLSTDPSPGGGP